MINNTTELAFKLEKDFQNRIQPIVSNAPWVLRITEHKGKPSPVVVVKERFSPEEDVLNKANDSNARILRDRGCIYGQSFRRCLPVIREIITSVNDDAGIPLELQRYLPNERIVYRGNLPLNQEAGAKLSLIFKLQERVLDMNRVELIARRVERFTREEAAYWLTRATQYGTHGNRWAQSGMRTMLGGQPGDKAINELLEKLRN